jgi:hypothetical protein
VFFKVQVKGSSLAILSGDINLETIKVELKQEIE